ncbi:hypothetical protein H9Q73_003074 [Fusarium xylarioides]|nr:hypothetical protein H9Q73_003074 [Fusarium xylarioides]
MVESRGSRPLPLQARGAEHKSISSNSAEGSSIMINGDGSGAFNKNIYNITYRNGLTKDEVLMAVQRFLVGTRFTGDKIDTLVDFLEEAAIFSDGATKNECTEANPTVFDILSQTTFVDFRAKYFPDLPKVDTDAVETTERSGAWTTDLCLEIMGASTVGLGPDTLRHTALLYHLCKSFSSSKRKSPKIVVQDLISQLIGTHAQSYTLAVCRHYNLSIHRVGTALEPGSFAPLWDLFGDFLKASNIKSLLLVIGDIDCLSDGLKLPPKDTLPINDFINGLVQLSQSNKILTKILVTAKAFETLDNSIMEHLDSSCMVHVKLPESPNRLRPPTPAPTSFRAPIERRVNQGISDSVDETPEERKQNRIGPAPNVTFNDQDEGEDSDVDFPPKSRPDLELLLDSESGSENDEKRGMAYNIPHEEGSTAQDGVSVLNSSGERGWVHQDSSDDEVSYSDLEQKPPRVILTAGSCQKGQDRPDLIDLLSDSDSDDD